MDTIPLSLQDYIKKIIKDDGYTIFDVEMKKFDSEYGGFLSDLHEIEIKGKTAEGEKNTNLFIKMIINLQKMTYFPVSDFFSNEEFMYNDLAKIFTKVQYEANVPLKERFKVAKAYDVSNAEVIILENLCKKNFKTYNRADTFPLKFAELAIEELAKFHSLSFVIENKMPEYFNEKVRKIKTLLRFEEDWRKYVQNVCIYIADMYDGNDKIKGKVENFLPVMLRKFPEYNSNDLTIRCALSHGDYRLSNILVREENGEPVEVIPVDYQAINYGCPIRDFLKLVFSGSDQEFRRKNMNNLKDLYFATISKFLKYFDMDVEDVYPREEFEKVYSEWLDYGLMISIFLSGFIFLPETGVDVKDISLADMPINFDERAKSIVREWIDDYIQWGYL